MVEIDKKFWEDMRWGETHHTELLRRYKDKWVVIYNKKVVSAGTNIKKIELLAEKRTGKKDLPVLYIDCGEHICGTN